MVIGGMKPEFSLNYRLLEVGGELKSWRVEEWSALCGQPFVALKGSNRGSGCQYQGSGFQLYVKNFLMLKSCLLLFSCPQKPHHDPEMPFPGHSFYSKCFTNTFVIIYCIHSHGQRDKIFPFTDEQIEVR